MPRFTVELTDRKLRDHVQQRLATWMVNEFHGHTKNMTIEQARTRAEEIVKNVGEWCRKPVKVTYTDPRISSYYAITGKPSSRSFSIHSQSGALLVVITEHLPYEIPNN